MKNLASELYRKSHGNCAQAVAMAWHSKTSQGANLSKELAHCGHGQAPTGLCGALYALHRIVGPEKAEHFTGCFAEASGGHTTCKGIRAAKTMSCIKCVEVAASLLHKHTQKS